MREPEEQHVNPDEKGEGLGPAEREVESALAGLRPAPVESGREHVLFRGGYEAGRRDARLGLSRWRMACGGLAGLAAALLVGLLIRPGPPVQERIVFVDRPGPVAAEQRSGTVVVTTPAPKPQRSAAAALDRGWLQMVWTPGELDGTQAVPVPIDPLARLKRLDEVGAGTVSTSAAPAGVREIRFRRAIGLGPEDVGGEAPYRVMTRGVGGSSSL